MAPVDALHAARGRRQRGRGLDGLSAQGGEGVGPRPWAPVRLGFFSFFLFIFFCIYFIHLGNFVKCELCTIIIVTPHATATKCLGIL